MLTLWIRKHITQELNDLIVTLDFLVHQFMLYRKFFESKDSFFLSKDRFHLVPLRNEKEGVYLNELFHYVYGPSMIFKCPELNFAAWFLPNKLKLRSFYASNLLNIRKFYQVLTALYAKIVLAVLATPICFYFQTFASIFVTVHVAALTSELRSVSTLSHQRMLVRDNTYRFLQFLRLNSNTGSTLFFVAILTKVVKFMFLKVRVLTLVASNRIVASNNKSPIYSQRMV